jgi:flagellar motor switch protein FliN/FliY
MAESQTVQNEPQQAAAQADAPADPTGVAPGTEVKQVEYNQVAPNQQAGQENLDLLLDIQMPITVIIGKAEIPLKKLLQLAPGSVLNLDKSIGQPVELFVQDIPVATADVVVVDNNFAVRIRELIATEEIKAPAASAKQGG